MTKTLSLKSFASVLTLSLCFFSQPIWGMDMNEETADKQAISSKKSQKSIQNETLHINSDDYDVHVPDMAWIDLRPHLENLIQLTVTNPMHEERMIHFKRLGKDSDDYFKWKEEFGKNYSFPISIGSGNEGAEGVKIDGKYEKYNSFLCITNRTKKEKEARELPYKIFEGIFNETQVNLRTFYNVMANVGFNPEVFAEGKHGYQDQIYVKPVRFNNQLLAECVREMKEAILSTLERVRQPYVAFILEFDQNVPIAQIYSYGGRESFFHEKEDLATILESEENRIYVVYYNDKKSTLDLHKLAVNEAKEKVTSFIKEKYDNFETECNIITGIGNHINPDGPSGVLNKILPALLKEPKELRHYIQSITLCNGGGFYKIKLVEPTHITLTSKVFEEDIEKVIYCISKENENGRNRLKITPEDQTSEYIDKVIMQAIFKIGTNQVSNLLPLPTSFNYGPNSKGQLRWFTNQDNISFQS